MRLSLLRATSRTLLLRARSASAVATSASRWKTWGPGRLPGAHGPGQIGLGFGHLGPFGLHVHMRATTSSART